MGCLPIYLTGFQTNDSTAYDKFHCLKDFNGLASYHNKKLKQAIKLLRKENPNVIIAYGDYYNALFWVFQHASLLGMLLYLLLLLLLFYICIIFFVYLTFVV